MINIFVFGSNEAGRHGAGAAKCAVQQHGAVYGQGRGLQGNSYAIPTKDAKFKVRSLELIKEDVDIFIEFAKNNTKLIFTVTAIGTGLAGYLPEDIAPMFVGVPVNVLLPEEFK